MQYKYSQLCQVPCLDALALPSFAFAWMKLAVLYWVASRFLARLFKRKCHPHRKTRLHHRSRQLFIQGHGSGNLSIIISRCVCMYHVWWVMPSSRADFHVAGMLLFMSDINQPSLPTPLYFILMSVSVFMALLTVFHSINYPNYSPLSYSIRPILFLPHWSFQLYYISLWKFPFSPDIILCFWLGLKRQLTN